MCQHWAVTKPMLAASAMYRPSSGMFTGNGNTSMIAKNQKQVNPLSVLRPLNFIGPRRFVACGYDPLRLVGVMSQ